MQASQMLRKGFVGYMVAMTDTQQEELRLEGTPIVREFPDILDDLPRMPPNREVEFSINPVPSVGLLQGSHWIALAELKELKKQLHDLLEKGFY